MQKAYNDGEEWTSRLGLLESGGGCGEKRKETFENEDRNFLRKFELKMGNLSSQVYYHNLPPIEALVY